MKINKKTRVNFDNTANIQYLAFKLGNNYLAVESGKEKQLFDIGETVISTGTGCLIPDIEVVIQDIIVENGYVKYFGNGLWHNQNDLRAK